MANVQGVAAQVNEAVAGRIGAGLRVASQGPPDTLRLVVAPEKLRSATEELLRLRARFLITVGIDTRPLTADYRVLYLFSLDAEHLFVVLECAVGPDDPHVDSITSLVPGANWAERECRDGVGVTPDGHPDPRRLLLADDWPEGLFPLRRDFPYDYRPPAAGGVAPVPKQPPEGASVLPIGPFFPVLEEPSYWRLFVEGETVVGCDYRGFYNHRGIEKLGESVLTYNEIPYLAERICGICGFIHSTAYCQAVEKAAGIEVPRRARYIRSIMLELERVHSHLLWLGIAGHILGFDTVLMQTWRMREPVMWLAEEISGNRKTYGMNTIGGLRRDLPAAVVPKVLKVVDEVERESVAVRDAIVGDTTLLARTKNVGVLTGEWARQVCVVGPPARASGVPIDARLDHPYAAYDEVPPRLCTQQAGDTWSRLLVRVEELLDSIRQVREGLARLPDGEVLVEVVDEIPRDRIGISVVEAPRGEAVHFVMTGGDNRPYRWRVRAPTYPNLQAMPAMIDHAAIADFPITLGSLDPCFSCTERVEAIDVRTRTRRVYSHKELLAMSRDLTRRGGRR
ncbi:MAG TPA: NADH-quinone oxidoreductase subunit C [Thermoleophilia bacterium]|nr:NADH-quinone oxidoreductase subunit C [Thermoleophilia bacterium]